MRSARGIVVVVLAALASIYVFAGAPIAVAVFAVQSGYALWRRSPWLIAVQAGLVYEATMGMGVSVGILTFLGGMLLRSRLWPLAPLVVVSAALLKPSVDATITVVLGSLVIYGLMLMLDRAAEMHSTQVALVVAAVAEERLRIAAQLNSGLGRALDTIIEGGEKALDAPARARELLVEVLGTARRSLADARSAASDYRATSLMPEVTTARAMLEAAGVKVSVRIRHTEPLGPVGALLAGVLREAVTDVVRAGSASQCVIETVESAGVVRLRVTDDGHRAADDATFADLPVAAAGGTLRTALAPNGHFSVEAELPHAVNQVASAPERYGLSVGLLAAVLVGFSAKALLQSPTLPVAACLTVIVVLQLRSVHGRHPGRLGVMALLTYAPLPFLGPVWLGVPGFLVGPILLAFPWRLSVPLVVLVLGSVAVEAVYFGLSAPVAVNLTVSALVTGLVIYSLLRLAQIVKEIQAARDSLARSAVVEERLRAARDLHDLLGHSLAAILLKCELARRVESPAESLREIIAMAEQAQADLRSVSGEQRRLSLRAEADSARSVLGAADIEVTLDLAHPELSAEVETVLSTVVREAVTNVLRHSDARHCTITTVSEGDQVRLRVRNDGVRARRVRRGSAGVGNLTTRLAALDGRLDTTMADGWFELVARAPYRMPVPPRATFAQRGL